MNRKLLRVALSRHCCSEWQIDEVATAEAAVTSCTTVGSGYDLVLMDDHFEVRANARTRARARRAPPLTSAGVPALAR